MNFTISDCVSRINQALNYPSISYEDVSHFFDQAISELNTSLRISLPTITEMRLEHTFKVSERPNTVILKTDPNADIDVVNTEPTSAIEGKNIVYYVNEKYSKFSWGFYIWNGTAWDFHKRAYAVTPGGSCAYEAIPVDTYAVWREIPYETVSEFSLTEYLPTDWIILFLIPYVCFKFAVRNGDNGALFSDEFTQGFQQLQTSYNVPNTVVLSTVAHKEAYRKIVKDNLSNLNIKVPTRAVFDSMKIPNGVRVVHGEGFFDSGGWGI